MQIPNFTAIRSIFFTIPIAFSMGSAALAEETVWRKIGHQGIEMMDGMGLTGRAMLEFSRSKSGNVKVDVVEMELAYANGAKYNNIDDSYSELPMVGFLSMLTDPKSKNKQIDETLAPIVGKLDGNGNFNCTDCASFVLDEDNIRASEDWISGVVVGDMIFHDSLRMTASMLLK